MSVQSSYRALSYSSHHLTERKYSGNRLSDYPPIVRPRSLPPSRIQTHPSPSWKRFLPTISNSLLLLVVLSTCATTTTVSILLALLAAPIVTTLMLACLSLAIMFVLTESSASGIWHHNRESENRFWIVVTLLFTASLLFAPDSPLALGLSHPLLALALIFASALYVNHYDRELSRTQLMRTPHLKRVSSVLLIDQQAAKDKLRVVSEALEQLDYRFVLLKGLRSAQITEREVAIVKAFEEASENEINYLVTNVNLPLLFYKMKDRDVMTWKASTLLSRTRIIHLLCITKLPLLHTAARVSIIDALMQLRLKAHLQAEEWVCNIIVNTHGRGLTRLKTACDAKGSISNLHKLVFRDISSAAIRSSILQHIAHEAALLSHAHRRKILSDVDDTLFSSGGKFPAGIDMSFPVRTVYPGVLTFYKELDLGCSHSGEWSEGRLGNLVFLSARPHIYKDKAESKSYLHFEQLRLQKGIGLHCVPTLLAGSLDSGWRMVFRGDYYALAVTKYENFCQFASLYPEFTFVFIGDNGQGDVMAAAMMAAKLGARLECVFIKQVQPVQRTPGWSLEAREAWRKFVFFTTFVGAALEAAKRGLIDVSAIQRIGEHAIARLLEMKDVLNAGDYDGRRRELNDDIRSANDYLEQQGMKALPYIMAESTYPIGAHTYTLFGPGLIIDYEPVHAVYVIQLLQWPLSDGSDAPYALLYQPARDVELLVVGQPGSRVWTPFGTGRLLSVRAPGTIHCVLLTSWGVGSATRTADAATDSGGYARAYLQATEVEEIVAAVGELVHIQPFGYGVVRRYRVDDGVYEVELLGLPSSINHVARAAPKPQRKGSFRKESASRGEQQQAQQWQQQHSSSERERIISRCSIGALYTKGAGMRRVDEEEQRSQRSCALM